MSSTGNESPVCVAVINLKGGVGKTTIIALGIVKLTHHKLRQPQDMGSEPATKHSI